MNLNTAEPMDQLFCRFKQMDGRSFQSYAKLAGCAFQQNEYRIQFRHIQGSPGAYPASVCLLSIPKIKLGLPSHCCSNSYRKIAAADYLLRSFGRAVKQHARQNHGTQGSGSFQPLEPPPQVLTRNVVRFSSNEVFIAFRISLPGSSDNRVIGDAATAMFAEELPLIIHYLKESAAHPRRPKKHCDTVEDFFSLQNSLEEYGLVAFIGDGAILPRRSGVSPLPLEKGVVPFKAPEELSVKVVLPNAGEVRGMGLRKGVNVLIGSGFHGKSTLLNALAKGIYPHIPGDGREQVITHGKALYVSSEEGRSIKGVDISAFIPELPGEADPQFLSTDNASSSTSEAAAIVEAIPAGAKFLLLDEDTSATNFLIRDHRMRMLIPEDKSTPFYDRVRELHDRFDVSTMIVVGGSSEYLGVADQVIAMRKYLPVSMAEKVRRLTLPKPFTPLFPAAISDQRRIQTRNFDPSYRAERLGKTIAVRIKPLRLQKKILEYGNTRLDLRSLTALVDPDQVLAIGYALLSAREKLREAHLSPAGLAVLIDEKIKAEGLDFLCPAGNEALFLASPRPLELAGAINRFRNLDSIGN